MNYYHLPLLLAALTAVGTAGEHKVQNKPFTATTTLDATFLPDQARLLKLDPDAWTDFTILDLAAQGAAIKPGQPVVTLDTEDLDRTIADDADATKLRKLALATAERELANLEKTTPWRLEAAKRSYQRAKEDLAYYMKVSRPLSKEQTERAVDQAERGLENATEELEQLLKMYKEDDLTEETEEIILKRQRSQVDSAEFRLKQTRIGAKKTLKTTLPRQLVDTEEAFKNASLNWETQQETLPRALAQKRLEVKKLRVEDKRGDEKSVELKKDRRQMDQKSPVAGRVYHGEITDGRWKATTAAKFMKVGGKIPPKAVFATIIPDQAKLELDAFVEESAVAGLKAGHKGFAAPAAARHSRIPVTVRTVATHPGLDGKYRVVLDLKGEPLGFTPVPGMKGKVTVTIYSAGKALTIPARALHEEADGSYTVKVKEGEKKTVSKPVTVGVESNGQIEVLSGLQPGQIVIVPEAPAKK